MAVSQRRLAALLLAFWLVSVAAGGEIKLHSWPQFYESQPFCDVPVLIDIEVVPSCTVTTRSVTLEPVGVGTYEGCSNLRVQCNYTLTLSCSIVPTGVVPGRYSVSLGEHDIDAPGGTTQLCVRAEDVVPGGPAGRTSMMVARVKITIAQRP